MYSSEITQLDSLTCRITSDNEMGTGTIIRINDDLSYIFTCLHVITNATQIFVEQKIDDKILKIEVFSEDIIYDDDESIDTAIIIISKAKYPDFQMPTVFFLVSNYGFDNANLCGFPEVKNTTTKFVNVSIDRGRISGLIFRTETKLDNAAKMSSQNCKGFSGGPIYIVNDGFVFICAIAKEYSDDLDYFTVININAYNCLLEKNKLETILELSTNRA